MTIEGFNNIKWGPGMSAIYKDDIYPIASCDFEERLVGLKGVTLGVEPDHIDWVRCENIEIVDASN